MLGIFLKFLLTVHLAGMATSVAGLYAGYFAFRRFNPVILNAIQTDNGDTGSVALVRALKSRRPLFWIGVALSLLSGALMMNLAYSAFMSQVWFIVKMSLLVMIIVVFAWTRRKEKGLIKPGHAYNPTRELSLARRIRTAYWLQFAFYLVIIVLAVFRFT